MAEMVGSINGMTAALKLSALPLLQDFERQACERSLSHFVRCAWHIIEPGTHFLSNWHIDLMAEYLEAVSQGQILRLIVNIPPRMMKSLMISVCWPAWCWIQRPTMRFVFSSYGQEIGTELSLKRRGIIESDWYRRNWPQVKLKHDQNMKMLFQNTELGHMQVTSTGGGITGKGGNAIIVDDPHNVKEIESDLEREGVLTYFDRTLYTRLDDKIHDPIVVVMQRLHVRDLTGYLLSGGGWTHLKIEGEAEEARKHIFPLSGRVHERERGELIWPEREGPVQIKEMKHRLGSAFAAQYQQRPVPLEGAIFKAEWWRFYDTIPPRFDTIIQSWDIAAKTGQENDYSVCTTWGIVRQRVGPMYYLLSRFKDKLEFPDLKRKTIELWAQFAADAVLVEDSSNGIALIQELRTGTARSYKENEKPLEPHIPITVGIPIIPINVKGKDKLARAQAVTPMIEGGLVLLPNRERFIDADIAWLDDYMTTMGLFPKDEHDDDVDSTTQFLNYVRQQRVTVRELTI